MSDLNLLMIIKYHYSLETKYDNLFFIKSKSKIISNNKLLDFYIIGIYNEDNKEWVNGWSLIETFTLYSIYYSKKLFDYCSNIKSKHNHIMLYLFRKFLLTNKIMISKFDLDKFMILIIEYIIRIKIYSIVENEIIYYVAII